MTNQCALLSIMPFLYLKNIKMHLFWHFLGEMNSILSINNNIVNALNLSPQVNNVIGKSLKVHGTLTTHL